MAICKMVLFEDVAERLGKYPGRFVFAKNIYNRCKCAKKIVILQRKIKILINMNIEAKREARFYICLFMGYGLLVGGFFSPPLGEIPNSVIISAGILLCMGALCVGVDLRGIIHELRLLKNEATTQKQQGDGN